MRYKKINSKTLYWGFPVSLLSSLNNENKTDITPISSCYSINEAITIGLNVTSKAYENIKLNKFAILNVIPDTMWNNIEAIANYSANIKNDKKGQKFTQDKSTIGEFNLISANNNIKFVDNCLLYIIIKFVDELIFNGIAHICFEVEEIYAKDNLIDENNYIKDDQFNVLLYQFRKYKKISNEILGQSFKYTKAK